MPSAMQTPLLLAGAAAIGVAGERAHKHTLLSIAGTGSLAPPPPPPHPSLPKVFINHQRNKSIVDKASDSLESARFSARQVAGINTPSDDVGKHFVDAKRAAQRP